ncbi:tRNA pseudouridine(38-40) synthase TruA [Salipaludibacillus agaradhaerens]|uniref:tRNA pseudouridine synthase A n=1 Tax=Salipaludibacillus agaradhaerens TaxID=76935 RepID=A0A9Q4G0S6_SALAG|nr:tRNA pseudouridine(38-40) synthase TruA [Salipaludibacillus agaradhaerens]MCR6098312.1 tRNA pseudouridine(38-40) synthase TruA [Salipaludibacillus agaradhaerens]MCR6116058.1 tRNA pseudouridine(38-40) synthase TruA [Salipaludibacillus agaradhaerens]
MQRVLATLSYDGARFHGYQRQPHDRSVQGEVEKALATIHKATSWPSTSSGRTDAGVHGIRQPVHFDTPLTIPEDRWPKALNSLLPDDIYVHTCRHVPQSFHARYDAVGKEYIYRLTTAKEYNVFKRHYICHNDRTLNMAAMQAAASQFIGTHDFTSFSSPKTDVVDKVRTIYLIDIAKEGDDWTFRFIGSGFLYQMVRVLMGTLLEVGSGTRQRDEIETIMAEKNRALAGKTAPAHGLYLSQVFYDEQILADYVKKFQ